MPTASGAARLLPGLAPIAARHDAVILDLWGVVHDGIRPYPGVTECLAALRRAGLRICLLSNAPRRVGAVADKLVGMGLEAGAWDVLMTSGEAANEALRRRDDPFHAALGGRCFHLGPARDASLFEGLDGLERVERLEDASFILNSGPDGWDETVAQHEPLLVAAAERDLPMICANPDLIVTVGETLAICAGALAQRYEALGGRVHWHGKPHPPVYRACLERLGLADRARVLAVGDSLRTDIAGGAAAGMATALVAGGIHRAELLGPEAPWGGAPDPDRLAAVLRDAPARPDWVLPALLW